MKRILSLLLVVLMLVSVFAACGGDDTTTTTTTPAPNPPAATGDTLAKKLYDEGFFMVGPADTSKTVGAAIASITAIFQELDSFFYPGDEYESPADKEIMIQVTRKRPSNATIKDALVANRVNSSNDYQIKISENTVNIVGSTDQALIFALQRFAAMLKEDSSLYFPAYDTGIVRYQWPATQLGGQPIQNYKIVIPTGADAAYQTAATNVQKAVFAASGYTLPIIDDSQNAGTTELVVGKTSRAVSASAMTALQQGRKNCAYDAILHASGNQYAITGGAMDAINIAVTKLAGYLSDAKQTEFATISKLFQKDGIKELSFGTTDAGEFRIVIAKDAAYDLRYIAWQMQQLLYNNFGYIVEIVTDDVAAVAGQKEIILGKTSRAASTALQKTQYATSISANGSFVINAGHYVGVQKVYAAMLTELDGQSGTRLTVSANHSGYVTDVELTWKADKNTTWQLESRYTGEDNAERPTPVMQNWTNNMVIGDLGFNFNDEYTLVWNDEFNGTSLNYDKWSHTQGMQYVDGRFKTTAPYISVEDGKVHLQSTMTKEGNNYYYNVALTLCTSDTMNFSGGYLEVKAKPPFRGMGEGPAIWLVSKGTVIYGDEYRQKHNGNLYPGGYDLEVDILENFSTKTQCCTNVLKWFHIDKDTDFKWTGMISQGPVKKENPTLAGRGQRQYYFKSEAEAQQYHTWGFLWTADMVAFSIDGHFYYALSLNDLDWDTAGYNYQVWVPKGKILVDNSPYGNKGETVIFGQTAIKPGNMAMQVFFDNTVMGEAGVLEENIPDGSYNAYEMHKYDDVRWPQHYYIEYVRVYQCKNDSLYTPYFYGQGTVMADTNRWQYGATGVGTPTRVVA